MKGRDYHDLGMSNRRVKRANIWAFGGKQNIYTWYFGPFTLQCHFGVIWCTNSQTLHFFQKNFLKIEILHCGQRENEYV